MFEFFPGNYRWSYNTWAALAAGAEFGDLGLILDRLRASGGRDGAWYEAWTWLADTENESDAPPDIAPAAPRPEIRRLDFSMRNFRMVRQCGLSTSI